MQILKIIGGIVVGLWVLGFLLHLFGIIASLAFSLFHILIVIAIIVFVVDFLMGMRNKVS